MKLTDQTVKNVKPGAARREIADSHLPGLYLIVQPTGARSWAVRYRHNGTPRKYTLGPWPLFNLKQARDAGGKALRAAAEGRDPGRERREARSDAFGAIAADFIERYCKRNTRQSTTKANETLLRRHILPTWKNRTIQSIQRRDILALLEGVAKQHRVAANRVHSCLSKLFSWATHAEIIESNPIRDVQKPSKEQSRERVLADSELARIWNGASKMGDAYGAAVRMLILTGARRDEVVLMKWSELDLPNRLWSLPPARTKNNRAHDVPLPDLAIAILQSMPRNGELVFADERGRIPSRARGKERLDKIVGEIESWRVHDLRRTLVSGLARLGIALPVIEKVINHTSGSFAGVVAVYQRHSFTDEKKRALQAWADHVSGLVTEGESDKVVRLARP